MSSIGASELLLILLIASIVIGPGNTKELIRTIGKVVRKLKKLISELKDNVSLSEEIDEIKQEISDVTNDISLKDDINEIKSEVSKIKRTSMTIK